jgi:hypothetical protein
LSRAPEIERIGIALTSLALQGVMDGYNGTIFAYGQTGTGKTHTMVGPAEPEEDRGVIPRAFGHVFRKHGMMI